MSKPRKSQAKLTANILALIAIFAAFTGLFLLMDNMGSGPEMETSMEEGDFVIDDAFFMEDDFELRDEHYDNRLAGIEDAMLLLEQEERIDREMTFEQEVRMLEQEMAATRGIDRGMAGSMDYDLSGMWYDEASGATYELQHKGSAVIVKEHAMLYGVSTVVSVGMGNIEGNELMVKYNTLMASSGVLDVSILKQGDVLSGNMQDREGSAVQLVLMRQ